MASHGTGSGRVSGLPLVGAAPAEAAGASEGALDLVPGWSEADDAHVLLVEHFEGQQARELLQRLLPVVDDLSGHLLVDLLCVEEEAGDLGRDDLLLQEYLTAVQIPHVVVFAGVALPESSIEEATVALLRFWVLLELRVVEVAGTRVVGFLVGAQDHAARAHDEVLSDPIAIFEHLHAFLVALPHEVGLQVRLADRRTTGAGDQRIRAKRAERDVKAEGALRFLPIRWFGGLDR